MKAALTSRKAKRRAANRFATTVQTVERMGYRTFANIEHILQVLLVNRHEAAIITRLMQPGVLEVTCEIKGVGRTSGAW